MQVNEGFHPRVFSNTKLRIAQKTTYVFDYPPAKARELIKSCICFLSVPLLELGEKKQKEGVAQVIRIQWKSFFQFAKTCLNWLCKSTIMTLHDLQ
jgi:hypothetical protein